VTRWKRATRCESTSCVEIQWRRAGRCESDQCVEVRAVDGMDSWRKTARCETAACVEVNARTDASAVLMRDSKDSDGLVLEFTAAEWSDFCTSARERRTWRSAVDVLSLTDGSVRVARAGAPDRALTFTVEEWDRFEAGVRGGEFDDPDIVVTTVSGAAYPDRVPTPDQQATDLISWLRDRLEEEEQDAQAAMRAIFPVGVVSNDALPEPPLDWQLHGLPPAVQQHIARHDPKRALDEIDAKQRILDLHRPVQVRSTGSAGGNLETCRLCNQFPAQYPCETMRALAMPYADRPGYREQWRPQ
jgi:hypothetical protein